MSPYEHTGDINDEKKGKLKMVVDYEAGKVVATIVATNPVPITRNKILPSASMSCTILQPKVHWPENCIIVIII
jgi:hypothetical protein